MQDMVGMTFGKLTVIKQMTRSSRKFVLCRCECGTKKQARRNDLRAGKTKTCGCFRQSHGMSDSPEYQTWKSIKQRCFNPNDSNYRKYGGRGITMCVRWKRSFEAFFNDMGPKPPKMSIERINNRGHYSPGNCRWATISEQNRNHSRNVKIRFKGSTRIISDWAQVLNIPRQTIYTWKFNGRNIPEMLARRLSMR